MIKDKGDVEYVFGVGACMQESGTCIAERILRGRVSSAIK